MNNDQECKACAGCWCMKPLSHFSPDPNNPGKLLPLCRLCVEVMADRAAGRSHELDFSDEDDDGKEPRVSRRARMAFEEIIGELDQVYELRDTDSGPCVFFLLCDGEVVYIGQARHLVLSVHRRRRSGYEFDRVLYLCVPARHLSRVARVFIKWLRPRLNTQAYMSYSLNTEEKRLIAAVASLSPIWDRLNSPDRVDWT